MVADGARRLRSGDPQLQETEVGPIQNAKQYSHVLDMIKLGVSEGAEVIEGSNGQPDDGGYFVRPTVLKNVSNDMQVARTEIFGPVVVAIPFDTEEEAIATPTTATSVLRAPSGPRMSHARTASPPG